ncbi:MAG: trypsin-like peptidase domain-containing protein [Polyangiaceae bacterium]|nr:trypsin-like peptidase domain-containing protein [Polyangiaceae bacterium]
MATSLHVVAGQSRIRIRSPKGDLQSVVAVAGYDPEWDLALLVVPTMAAHPLLLGNSDAMVVGERVLAVGNPMGLSLTVSEGIVSALRGSDGRRDVLQTTAPISEGSSGGPLLSSRGTVVGITTAFLTKGQALNFAVASSHLRELMANAGESALPLGDFALLTGPTEKPRTEPTPAPSPESPPRLPKCPESVAGFVMGLPVDELNNYCPHYTLLTPGMVSCPYTLVPMPFASAPVDLTFGAGQVTSIGVQAHNRTLALRMLAERYGTPTTLRQDKKFGWVRATSWPQGGPGAVEWRCEGGRIRLVSLDGKKHEVVFASDLYDRLSETSY